MRGAACIAALLLPLLAAPAWAAGERSFASCVSDDTLSVGSGDAHAWLDAADVAAAATAIQERFPMLARDGFAPARLLLWDRPQRGWIYVALLQNPHDAAEMCFTATINARAVGLTKALLRKYFPALTET